MAVYTVNLPPQSKAVAGPYTVLSTESGTVFDNRGGATITTGFTLPLAVVGMTYTFSSVYAASVPTTFIQVTPNAADTIYQGNRSAGAAITSTSSGAASITLVCTSANTWAVTSLVGTWT